jgi:stringent starvation protein B
VQVPQAYIQDGRIVLNISPDAIHQLSLNNDWVSFSARFAGQAEDIFIPIKAVQAIYCKENNEGMFFPEEEQDPPPDDKPSGNDTHSKGRPSLKVIK